nr:uncharacterized protein LOC107443889 isoform X2 [Parasteatoda tepidariorum]XP_042909363.1 uncharacterized protein LOC107443889 isoform X2 [Parasteatoda tepidariorum]
MGRLSKVEKKKRGWKQDLETQKTRHRFADTKYRSKVQFLFEKVEELVNNNKSVKTKKDKLLLNSIECIVSLEKDIVAIAGEQTMRKWKQEFLEFLIHEQAFWKKEKDLSKWWSRIQIIFSCEYFISVYDLSL